MTALAFLGVALLPDGPNLDQRADAFANLVGKLAGVGAVMIPLYLWLQERKA